MLSILSSKKNKKKWNYWKLERYLLIVVVEANTFFKLKRGVSATTTDHKTIKSLAQHKVMQNF